MDSLTHIFVGAALGQSVSKKDFNRKAALIGAIACTAPDLDVFIRSEHNPLLLMEIHRSFSHSLLFIPIGALLVAGILLLFWRSIHPYWRQVLMVCLLAYASHGLLDACTSYGTQLFWPFSHRRISWDIISIVDIGFTLGLIVGVISAYVTRQSKPAILAIAYALLYLGFCSMQHYRAAEIQTQLIENRSQQAEQQRVMPAFASQYHWNSLYIANNRVYLDSIYTPLFKAAYAKTEFSVPLFLSQDLPIAIRQDPQAYQDYLTFRWFTQGYIAAAMETPLVLVDLRYVQKQNPPTSLWELY